MQISGWGNYPKIESEEIEFSSLVEAAKILRAGGHHIVRGMGRSYGDASLSKHVILSTRNFNRMLGFDDSELGVCGATKNADSFANKCLGSFR